MTYTESFSAFLLRKFSEEFFDIHYIQFPLPHSLLDHFQWVSTLTTNRGHYFCLCIIEPINRNWQSWCLLLHWNTFCIWPLECPSPAYPLPQWWFLLSLLCFFSNFWSPVRLFAQRFLVISCSPMDLNILLMTPKVTSPAQIRPEHQLDIGSTSTASALGFLMCFSHLISL